MSLRGKLGRVEFSRSRSKCRSLWLHCSECATSENKSARLYETRRHMLMATRARAFQERDDFLRQLISSKSTFRPDTSRNENNFIPNLNSTRHLYAIKQTYGRLFFHYGYYFYLFMLLNLDKIATIFTRFVDAKNFYK